MKPNALILMVGASRPELDAALEALRCRFVARVVRIERPATACARIGGGGVDAVLVNASPAGNSSIESIAMLREGARQVPVLAVCDDGDELAGQAAVRAGAAAYLPVSRSTTELCSFLEAAMGSSRKGHGGAILSFLGAKGGVGTTTLAQNAASTLARLHRVILVELRPQLGALGGHFMNRPPRRNLADLLKVEPAAMDASGVEACLWPYTGLPALRVLFGPQTIDAAELLSPAHVRAILDSLAQLADYVVLDLPASCSEANRAALQGSDLLVLVLERDPICLSLGKAILEALEKWHAAPPLTGAVVVNRLALASPFDLSKAGDHLGIPLFGGIPPAPELCIAARSAFAPLVLFDPESLVASGIDQFVSHLRIRSSPARSS